jgi:hypothetical protein
LTGSSLSWAVAKPARMATLSAIIRVLFMAFLLPCPIYAIIIPISQPDFPIWAYFFVPKKGHLPSGS